MEGCRFIDIHTHTYAPDKEIMPVLNVFPQETEKLSYPVYKSAGLHPWHIEENTWQTWINAVKESMKDPNVIAVGETGLDKAIQTNYQLQTRVFLYHLEIASACRKPVIIHCVRSYGETLAIRKKSDISLPWIFHWFNADERMAFDLIRYNCFLSFGHMLFREDSKAFRVFPKIPSENIFFETDDAGFTIKEVYAKAAVLRNCDHAGLLNQIMHNFARCFNL